MKTERWHSGSRGMTKNPDGDWVSFSAYEQLEKELAEERWPVQIEIRRGYIDEITELQAKLSTAYQKCDEWETRCRIATAKLAEVEGERDEERGAVEFWSESHAHWKQLAEEKDEKLAEYEGKLESGYAFCHPCDDCTGLRAATRYSAEVVHLEAALETIAQGEEILGDVDPVRYAAGTLLALKMIRGRS